MKIVMCARRFTPPFVGGVDVYTDRLGRALQRLGHDIIVIGFSSDADCTDDIITVHADEYNGIDIRRVTFAFAHRPQEAFDHAYDPQMGQAVGGILEEERPDLLIVMNFYMLTLAVVEVSKRLGIPVVHVATDFLPICRRATLVRWDGNSCTTGESLKSCSACFVSHHPVGRLASTVLGHLPEETLIDMARRQDARSAFHPLSMLKPYWHQIVTMERRLKLLPPLRDKIDLVLAPTQYTLGAFVAAGFRRERVHLLPFAVDPAHPLAKVEHVPAAHTRFLFVGRLQPYKGAHLLVEAFNNLDTPNGATLTLYGTLDGHDAYFSELQARMASNERITFGGQIAPSKLGEAFAEADYFILPSTWHENSPLILLDALQSKTPVIASDIGGVTDVIKHNTNGLLFTRGDQQALQQTMQRVIDTPALIDQLRPGINLSTIDDYAKTLIETYQDRTVSQRSPTTVPA